MVLLKLAVLGLFVTLGATGSDPDRLHPFAPMGMAGIGAAASTVFFSFIGLDAVSTAGEEVRNPRRTLPRAIICALLAVTTVYVLVALVGVGAQPWTAFAGQEAGLSAILAKVPGAGWPGLPLPTDLMFAGWLALALAVYLGYSRHRSRLR
ncbi:APC family permease [Streptomyces sp. MS1.AVA.3]|uniref:APC family permease n=1 Tax=Streptomyces decoyicus TaxID=249567 RepID=UPI0030C64899